MSGLLLPFMFHVPIAAAGLWSLGWKGKLILLTMGLLIW